MRSQQLDQDVSEYLVEAAAAASTDVNSLLRRVFSIAAFAENPIFARYAIGLPAEVAALLEALDRNLRVLNPGLHHVFRDSYIGYRRAHKLATGPTAGRSQTFVSLRPRRKGILATLPLAPAPYLTHPLVRDVSGVGHHGVGDLQFEIGSDAGARDFFSTFAPWLRAE